MENDKKYSITMGLMIFCFVIIVAGALGIGLGYIKIGGNTDKEDSDVGNVSQVENNKEEQKVNLDDVYKKYDFDWASKKKDTFTYVKDGKITIELADKTYEVNFNYGTPVLVCDIPAQAFSGIVVLNDKGEVYKSSEAEYDVNDNLQSSKFTFTKVNLDDEIIDMSRSGGDGVVPYSGPYYMTKSGKVINGENKTYEEVNKDHINLFGGLDYLIFVCEDKTVDVGRMAGDYVKVVDENGKNIKIKYIFDPNTSNEYKIIDENNKYYTLLFNSNGVAYYEEKTVREFSYDNTKYVAKVIFTDGEVETYEYVYSSYDAVNNKDM